MAWQRQVAVARCGALVSAAFRSPHRSRRDQSSSPDTARLIGSLSQGSLVGLPTSLQRRMSPFVHNDEE